MVFELRIGWAKYNFASHLLLKAHFKYFDTTATTTSLTKVQTLLKRSEQSVIK